MRASDAERDEAVQTLAAHYADGRLDQTEFDQRSDAALAAVTREQLRRLFTDLPAREPAQPAPARGPYRNRPPLPLPPIFLALLLALGVMAVIHGLPPFPLFALLFILSRRRRRWNRPPRPWS